MLFGHFLVMIQGMTGATVPTRKKKRRAIEAVSTVWSLLEDDISYGCETGSAHE